VALTIRMISCFGGFAGSEENYHRETVGRVYHQAFDSFVVYGHTCLRTAWRRMHILCRTARCMAAA